MSKNYFLIIVFVVLGGVLFYIIDRFSGKSGSGLNFTQQIVSPDLHREMLQDVNDPGANLFLKTCSQCHDIPNPKTHSPEEWPGIVARMFEKAATPEFSAKGLFIPSTEEVEKILRYLSEKALERD